MSSRQIIEIKDSGIYVMILVLCAALLSIGVDIDQNTRAIRELNATIEKLATTTP